MGLVESVSRKLGNVLEDARGQSGVHLVGSFAALHKFIALSIHNGLLLLAHGPSKQIGLAQRVTRKYIGGPLDLLLVDHDAKGILQYWLQKRMVILNGGVAAFAVDVGGKHFHRSRPIERNHGDNFFNVADVNPADEFPHSTAFHLEYPYRVGPTE